MPGARFWTGAKVFGMDPLEALASQAFCRVAEAQQSSGNQVRLLRDGPEVFPAWLQAIAGARRLVDLENYILQEDQLGQQFADALIAAAKRGVECRVIYDWLGCLTRSSSKFWKQFAGSGVALRCYNPPHVSDPLRWISRDHRKVLVVDGEVAFTGGLCIGNDWMGDPARNIPPWRDTAIEIKGPAVAHISAAFDDSWDAAAHRRPIADIPAGSTLGDDAAEGVDVSVVAGRPDSMGLYRLEQLVAEIAAHSLWLTDGYFVATTGYVRTLVGAAKAGVDVRLLVPGSSNWPLVGALSKSAYRPLLEAGVRVFEWNGPMIHAKTAVADGVWTRIGSSNSNLASWVTNRELDVTIKDHGLAAQMEAMFRQDMENSTEVVLGRGRSGIEKPMSLDEKDDGRDAEASAGRLLSGAIGLGSTLTASFSRRRELHPEESLVVLGGGVLLLLFGLVAILLPRFIAWIIAISVIWPGIVLLLRSIKLWRTYRHENGH
jgi:cardiolipin synthase